MRLAFEKNFVPLSFFLYEILGNPNCISSGRVLKPQRHSDVNESHNFSATLRRYQNNTLPDPRRPSFRQRHCLHNMKLLKPVNELENVH